MRQLYSRSSAITTNTHPSEKSSSTDTIIRDENMGDLTVVFGYRGYKGLILNNIENIAQSDYPVSSKRILLAEDQLDTFQLALVS